MSLWLSQGIVEVMYKILIRNSAVQPARFSFKIFQHTETDVLGTQLLGTEAQPT